MQTSKVQIKDERLAPGSKKISKRKSRAKDSHKGKIKKRQAWTNQEDDLLLELVAEHGTHWATISKEMGGARTGKQIRDRYLNKLVPGITSSNKWTAEEDQQLLELYYTHGKKWCNIARELPGRTEVMVKNRFYGKYKKILSQRSPFFLPETPKSSNSQSNSLFPAINQYIPNYLPINENIQAKSFIPAINQFMPTPQGFYGLNFFGYNYSFNQFGNIKPFFNQYGVTQDFNSKLDEQMKKDEEKLSDEVTFIDFSAQDNITRSMLDDF